MHLVNTIRYMFMSFSEFCFYYYCNDDTVSGNAVSTTDVTRSWREKNDGDSLIFLCAAIFGEDLRWSQSLTEGLHKLLLTSPSHTHANLYFYMKDIYIYLLQTDISFLVTELPEEKWLGLGIQLPFIYQGIGYQTLQAS